MSHPKPESTMCSQSRGIRFGRCFRVNVQQVRTIGAAGSLCFAQAGYRAFKADLVRTIHSFDALLVLTGSTASASL